MKRPIALSLFAGAGGLCLGFEQAGFDVPVAVELDPIHAEVHRRNFLTDWHTLNAPVETCKGKGLRELTKAGDVDVVMGGPPCQAFSLAGQRKSTDPRTALIDEFVRIVAEIRPKYFCMENVKGLTQTHCLAVLNRAIAQLKALGYNLPPWQILNAKDYGVPQSRERLFLLGSRSDMPAVNYPLPTYSVTVAEALDDIPNNSYVTVHGKLPDHQKLSAHLSLYAQEMRCISEGAFHKGYWRVAPRGFWNSHKTDHSLEVIERFEDTRPGHRDSVSRFHRLHPGRVSMTLRAGTDNKRGRHTAPRPIHYKHPRCITVREMARLHGFPDWFRFHGSIWHGARQIGNAVPPPLGRAIASEIYKSLTEAV